jgi:hypothetical protein
MPVGKDDEMIVRFLTLPIRFETQNRSADIRATEISACSVRLTDFEVVFEVQRRCQACSMSSKRSCAALGTSILACPGSLGLPTPTENAPEALMAVMASTRILESHAIVGI